MSNVNDKTVGRGTPELIRSGTSRKTSNGNDGRTENPSALVAGSAKNVSRDSKIQLVDDVLRSLGGNDKVAVATTLRPLIESLQKGEPGNDVRIFFPKSWKEDIEFSIDSIEHNVGGYGLTQIILKKV